MTDILLSGLEAWRDWGVAGLAVLAVAFAVGAATFVPRPPMCVLGGVAFGMWAVPAVAIGSAAGAALAFILSRHFLSEAFLRHVDRRLTGKAVVQAIDEKGWRLVGLLRLGSPIPGSAVSYFCGLTRIGFWPFTLASLAGVIPQTILYVYLGAAGRAVLDRETATNVQVAVFVVGLILTLVMFVLIARRARAALGKLAVEKL